MNSTPTTKRTDHSLWAWGNLFTITLFSAYFYAFMEWLFFVTKPSSLSILTPLEIGTVLIVTGGAIALPLVGVFVILFLSAWLARDTTWHKRLLAFGNLVPAMMLAVTALIMFDNFTYTVFNFGIVSSAGVWRALYTLGFGIALWQGIRFAHKTNALP